MKKIMITVLMALIIIIFVSISFAENQQLDKSMLDLTISVNGQTFANDDEVVITLELRNISTVPIIINARMLLNMLKPDGYGEVAFIITAPSGDEVNFSPRIRVGYPKTEDFIKLLPGESVSETYNLGNWYYPFDEKGIYSIYAIYHNNNDPEDNQSQAWKGQINSNEIFITIK